MGVHVISNIDYIKKIIESKSVLHKCSPFIKLLALPFKQNSLEPSLLVVSFHGTFWNAFNHR